ncbi:hypothetical protein MPTK2_3g12260 [Marchantia polymorpha subsp. ruderalis]
MESDSDEKASSSEPSNPTSVFMGRSFPEDLLLTVMRKLPLESLMRFRCVCRHWNDLFMSREFSLSLWQKSGKLVPLYPGDGGLNLYDTSNRCWVQRDLNFGENQGSFVEDKGYELVASGGGLLTFLAKPHLDSNWREQFPTFIVSNPLTRQYHRLPTLVVLASPSLNISEVGDMLCGIDVDLETGYYTFLFLDHRSTYGGGETYIYDSKLLSWRICSRLRSSYSNPSSNRKHCTDFNRYQHQCVTKDGKFHWVVSGVEGGFTDLVYIYDLKLDIWSRLDLSIEISWAMLFRCMEHNGEVLIVGHDDSGSNWLRFFEIVDQRLEPRFPERRYISRLSLREKKAEPMRLYLREKKAEPMQSVADMVAPLLKEGTWEEGLIKREVRIKWCVGARDEVIFLLQDYMEDYTHGVPRPYKSNISRPILRYTGVDDSWAWLSNWKIVKEDHDYLPILFRVWTYQPSLVSPGLIESKIKHPHGMANVHEFDLS